jgi:tripartite-type tricarboxylate transporter receptor subunit TctC
MGGGPRGGEAHAVARTVAEAMSKTLGQPIVINKPGAATNIAAGYVANPEQGILFTADFATLA